MSIKQAYALIEAEAFLRDLAASRERPRTAQRARTILRHYPRKNKAQKLFVRE